MPHRSLSLAAVLTSAALIAAGCGDDDASKDTSTGETTRSSAPTQSEPGDAPGTSSKPPAIEMARVGTFDQPVLATLVPGTDQIAVVEKTGRVRIASGMTCAARDNCPEQPVTTGRVALDLSSRVSTGGEQGLLGLAFHPKWPSDPRIFINYTDREGDTHIEAWTMDGPAATATRTKELLRIPQPFENHNGGGLAFGPKDGLLYIGTGDGGSGGDPGDRAQDDEELLGKMLRLDVDGGGGERGYAIPDGNLSATSPIWALGLRNPWRFSFDQETGALWIGDVGQNGREEIDALTAAQVAGGTRNFGWKLREGFQEFEGGGRTGPGTMTQPLLDYDRDAGCSVTGGHVYRGTGIQELQGWYVFADFCGDTLRLVRADAVDSKTRKRGAVRVFEQQSVRQISSFGEGLRQELLATTTDGGVYQIVASA